MAFNGTGSNVTSLNASNIASGTLAVARGGTGTASPSIVAGSGISVSGTWPNQTVTASGGGVTSLNGQTGAITNTTYEAIGSNTIATKSDSGTSSTTAGSTVSGGVLERSNNQNNFSTMNGGFAGAGLSGTWRAMHFQPSGTAIIGDSNYKPPALWVRVS